MVVNLENLLVQIRIQGSMPMVLPCATAGDLVNDLKVEISILFHTCELPFLTPRDLQLFHLEFHPALRPCADEDQRPPPCTWKNQWLGHY